MMAIDRTKYMNLEEIKSLRIVTEAWAITDLRKGRKQGPLAWMLVDMALSTGLRVAEMASVEIKDIDHKRGMISVVRLKRKRRKAETQRQYDKRNRESLALGKELTAHLKDYIANTGQTKGKLFTGQRGDLSAQGLQRIFKSAIKRANLPDSLSIHSARHSIAVHLLKKTGNLRMVQKQLGHASPATTANMYADISFEDMQDGISGLYEE